MALRVPDAFAGLRVPLALFVTVYAARAVFEVARYGRVASYHMWSARVFGLLLAAAFEVALATGRPSPLLTGAPDGGDRERAGRTPRPVYSSVVAGGCAVDRARDTARLILDCSRGVGGTRRTVRGTGWGALGPARAAGGTSRTYCGASTSRL